MTALLLTRPLEKSLSLQKTLAHKNIDSFILPMMSYEDFPFSLGHINDFDGLIITSPHSADCLKYKNIAKDFLIFAVGENTEQSLSQNGFTNIVTGNGTGADLIQKILNDHHLHHFQKLHHLSGVDIATDFIAPLATHGVTVTQNAIYKAHLAHNIPSDILQALTSHKITAVAFFSARVAEEYARLLTDLEQTTLWQNMDIFCLSPRIADTCAKVLENSPPRAIYISDRATTSGFLEKVYATPPFSDFINDLGL